MSEIKKNDNVGGLIISEDVIASIAKNATLDIEGVAGLATQPMSINSVFRKDETSKSVKVHSTENDMVIDVYLILKFGVKIPTVSEAIQQSVKDAVQNMTGRVVNKVNIHVMDILLAKEDAPEEAAQD